MCTRNRGLLVGEVEMGGWSTQLHPCSYGGNVTSGAHHLGQRNECSAAPKPQIHVLQEPQNVTFFGNRIIADAIRDLEMKSICI